MGRGGCFYTGQAAVFYLAASVCGRGARVRAPPADGKAVGRPKSKISARGRLLSPKLCACLHASPHLSCIEPVLILGSASVYARVVLCLFTCSTYRFLQALCLPSIKPSHTIPMQPEVLRRALISVFSVSSQPSKNPREPKLTGI